MKKKNLKRLLSLVLALTLLVEACPLSASAQSDSSVPSVSEDLLLPEDYTEENSSSPQMAYEIPEERGAAEKRFRLSDGSFVSASYPTAVHYQAENGEYEDIDNTLTLASSRTGRQSLSSSAQKSGVVYQAENGEETKYFTSVLYPDSPVIGLQNEALGLAMSLLRPETAQALIDSKAPEGSLLDEKITVSSEVSSEIPEETPDALLSSPDLPEESEDPPVSSLDREAKREETSPAPSAASSQGPEIIEEASGLEEKPASGLPSESSDISALPSLDPEPSPVLPAPTLTPDTPVEAEKDSLMASSVPAKVENPQKANRPMGIASSGPASIPPLEEQVQPQKISSKVTYENVWPGVDLQYQTYGYNVKESIILQNPQETYRYSFLLNLQGLSPALLETGGIDLKNEKGETVYEIPAPYMTDAAGATSFDAHYELHEASEGYVLTIEAEKKWIEEEERLFPVTIDPSLILIGSDFGNSFTASSLTSEKPNTTGFGGESLYIGHRQEGYDLEAFFQFGSLPTLPDNCSVINATLNLYQNGYSPVGMDRLFARVHEVTSTRPASYATDADWIRGITWNTKPAFDKNTAEVFARLNNGKIGSYVAWDISRLVSKWYETSPQSRMLAIDAIGPSAFSSSNCAVGSFWMNINQQPLFLIHYRNTVGLESRFTYQTASAGKAGTVNVSDYSAQMTLANTLFSSNSEVLPFDLTLYYNSPYAGKYFTANTAAGIHTANYTNMKLGTGWKLSAQETVVKTTVKTQDESLDYYVYTDEDGTEHYFQIDPSKSSYPDEDGLGLTLSASGVTHTLKDEKNNRKEFYNGYLYKYTDRNGNCIYYLYNDDTAYSSSNPFSLSSTTWRPSSGSNNQLKQIYQINDNGSTADVLTLLCKLNYSGGNLSSVTDAAGRAYTFDYSTVSGKLLLSNINFPDNINAVEYHYNDDGRMNNLHDQESWHGIVLEYNRTGVKSLREMSAETTFSGSYEQGSAWHSYSPSLQQRQYRFYGLDGTRDTADDVVTHYAFDLEGRTTNIVSHNTDRTKVLGTSAVSYTQNAKGSKKNNRVTGSSGSGIMAVNLIHNSGMETLPDSNHMWTSQSTVSTGSSVFRPNMTEGGYTTLPRTGGYLMKMYLPSASGKVMQHQTVYLQAGKTYVFSGYANSAKITSFSGTGGLSLSFQNAAGTVFAKSRVLNYATSRNVESGWSRLEVAYTPSSSGSYRVCAVLENASKYAAFDDFQLEESVTRAAAMPAERSASASGVNLLQMGSFDFPTASGFSKSELAKYWSYNSHASVPLASGEDAGRGYIMQIPGHPDASRRASQTVTLNRSSNSTYMLSAWGKARSVPDCAPASELSGDNIYYKRFFGMIAKLVYSDTTTPEYQYVAFEPQYDGWQYTSGFIVPKRAGKTVSTITVSLAYDFNVNTAWFDQVSLTEEPAQTYTYDDNGKLTSVTSSAKGTETYTYTGADLTRYVSPSSGTFTYTYDGSHNMTKASNDGVNMTASYDGAGNGTSSKLQKGTSGIYMQTNSTYTADQNHTASSTDASNLTTQYVYDNLGRTSEVKTPYEGGTLTVSRRYVAGSQALPSSTYVSGTISLGNSYSKGVLASTTRKSYRSGTTKWLKYSTPTDKWRNVTSINVSGGSGTDSEANVSWSTPITLASYQYLPKNGPMSRATFGNGSYEDYSYDLYGRLASTQHHKSASTLGNKEAYTYDAWGNISHVAVTTSGGSLTENYFYEYDTLGRLIHSEQNGSGLPTLHTEHLYDAHNRISSESWQVGTGSYQDSYQYNNNNGTLSSMTSGVGKTLTLGYDALLRPQSRAVSGVYQKRQNYTNFGTDRQSGQLNYLNYFKADGTTPKIGYRYLYDAGGNIKEVKSKTGSNALATESTFQYDKLGQLTKVTGKTNETYTYDTAGNMLSRTWSSGSYSYLTSYLYENTAWGDLLTSYKGQKLAYEGQTYVSTTSVTGTPKSGNPISYYNGTRWTMGWQGANQLTSASASGKTLSFTYDTNGLRSSKTYNGVKYQYAYAGDRLLWQGWSGNEMFFFYDEQGAPFAFRHVSSSGTVTVGYYFLNGQGDVVQIENASGTVLASYAYDPWGKHLTLTGTFATINPLRYRGYYYDTETGFYYLQSRYYDPTISRFINADSYAATGGLLGYNMFAYCENNPVNALDSSGSYPIEVGDNPDMRPAAAAYEIESVFVMASRNDEPINTQEPPPESSGYKPPKKGLNLKNGKKGRVRAPDGSLGWPAYDGGIWVPKQKSKMDGGSGWVIQYPKKSHKEHEHGYANGYRRTHNSTTGWDTAIGVGLIVITGAAIIAFTVDDLTGIGVYDDVLLPGLGASFGQGLTMIFG